MSDQETQTQVISVIRNAAVSQTHEVRREIMKVAEVLEGVNIKTVDGFGALTFDTPVRVNGIEVARARVTFFATTDLLDSTPTVSAEVYKEEDERAATE